MWINPKNGDEVLQDEWNLMRNGGVSSFSERKTNDDNLTNNIKDKTCSMKIYRLELG